MKPSLKIPEIGTYLRGTGTLRAIEEIPPQPVPPTHDYIFEEITAYVELRLNGKMVSKGGTYWDAYGLGSSVDSAKEEAVKWLKDYAITTASEMEVVVVKVASLQRKHQTHERNHYEEEYAEFRSRAVGGQWKLPDDKKEVVWSSKTGDVK